MKPVTYYNFLINTESEKLNFLYDKGLENYNKYDSKTINISRIIVLTCFLHFFITLDSIDTIIFFGVSVKRNTIELIRMGLPLFLSSLNFLYIIFTVEKMKISSFLNEIFSIKFDKEIVDSESSTKITDNHWVQELLIQKPLGKSLIDNENNLISIIYSLAVSCIYIIPFYIIYIDLAFIYKYNGFIELWLMFFIMPIVLNLITFLMFSRVIYVGVLDTFKSHKTKTSDKD